MCGGSGWIVDAAISISDFDGRLLIDLITEIEKAFYELAYQTHATEIGWAGMRRDLGFFFYGIAVKGTIKFETTRRLYF